MTTACSQGYHQLELKMPVADPPYVYCPACGLRLTVEEGTRLQKAIAARIKREQEERNALRG